MDCKLETLKQGYDWQKTLTFSGSAILISIMIIFGGYEEIDFPLNYLFPMLFWVIIIAIMSFAIDMTRTHKSIINYLKISGGQNAKKKTTKE